MSSLGKSCVAEALGAGALSFIGAGVICMDAKMGAAGAGLLGIALAHGIILSIGVSATMNVSGGHLNPAVTIAMLFTGRISLANAVCFVLSQLVGATIAGALVYMIFKGMMAGDVSVVKAAGLGTPQYNPAQINMGLAILIEACLTFLLVFAIFGTAVDPRAPKIGGFGIGLTIAADILLGGPLTGAAMNPSRTFGPGIVAFFTGNLDVFPGQHVVYWVGPVAGALIAAWMYDLFVMEKKA